MYTAIFRPWKLTVRPKSNTHSHLYSLYMLLNCFELNRLFYLPRNVLIIYKIHTFKKTANNHFEKAVFLNVSEMHIKNPENVFHFAFVPRHSS